MNKHSLAWIVTAIFSLASGISQVAAQDMGRPSAVFTQEDLDQMPAPIALYSVSHPDAATANAAPQIRSSPPAAMPATRVRRSEHEQRSEQPEQPMQRLPQQEARAHALRPQEHHEQQARPEPRPQQREERDHRSDDK